MIFVDIGEDIKFEDCIKMSNWDLVTLGDDLYKLIGIDGESHFITYYPGDEYYSIISDVHLDMFVSG